MSNIFITLTRYIIAIFAVIYAYESFRVQITSTNDDNSTNIPNKANSRRHRFMLFIIFFIHFISFLAIYVQYPLDKYIIFYGLQTVLIATILLLYTWLYPNHNRVILYNICFFLTNGMIILMRLNFDKAVKQFIILAASSAIFIIIPLICNKIRTTRFKKLTYVYCFVGIGLLAYLLIFGEVTYGAKISISLGSFSFQPAEFVKIMYVLFLAGILYKASKNGSSTSLKAILLSGVLAAIQVIILVFSRDLGSALILFVTYLFMIYCASRRSLYLLAGLGFGSIAAYFAYLLFSHIQTRVHVWLNPFNTINTSGYQIAQSLFSIGTGGFFGLGIFKGQPNKIPVVYEDFIFSAFAEEYGTIFSIAIVLICLSTFIAILSTAINTTDLFKKLLCVGFGVIYAFQVFLTIGGAIKLIPSTGVTLPFLSYGGTSVLCSLVIFSLIETVSMNHKKVISEASEAIKQKNQTTANIQKSNKYLLRTVYIYSTLYSLLIGFLLLFMIFESRDVINNPYNTRQDLFAKVNIRGTIYSADYDILAQTVTADDGTEKRVYPYNNLFSHVCGYIGAGKSGIESNYNFELLTSSTSFINQFINELKNKKNISDNIVTTLKVNLQQTASDALGSYKGAVIALDPSTGKILTMVSKPDFNPNTIASDWDSINSNESNSSCLLNRATQSLYVPGSVFKTFTLLEYLKENPDYEGYKYTCSSMIEFYGNVIKCHNLAYHGTENLKQSYANSCNTSFVNLGLTLDVKKYISLLNDMLFNKDLKLSFSTSKSEFKLTENSNTFEIGQTVIGQGKTLVSPIHMLMIMSSIANNGVIMEPYYVMRIENHKGKVEKEYSPSIYKELMTSSTADLLKEYMRAVVTDGTAGVLNVPNYTAYGKTGTAEIDDSKGLVNSWFTGFAQTDNKSIAICVVLESINQNSERAINIAKKVIDAYYSN